MPVALPGAVGAAQLTLLHSPHVATLCWPQEPWSIGVLGCAATLCPGTPPGTAVLQEQDFWTAGGRGPQEGGCRSPAEQPGPVGALCPSVGLGRDIYLLLSEDLGVEGHFGGLVLLTEESVTS